jgi:hypothetical protein
VHFQNETFKESEVVLDNNEYVGCTFESCRFVYSGAANPAFEHNVISGDLNLEIRGAAKNTAAVLAVFWSAGRVGRRMVTDLLEDLAEAQQAK